MFFLSKICVPTAVRDSIEEQYYYMYYHLPFMLKFANAWELTDFEKEEQVKLWSLLGTKTSSFQYRHVKNKIHKPETKSVYKLLLWVSSSF